MGRESEDERGKEQREKAERVMGQRKELWEERGKMRKSTEKVPIQTVVRINLVFFLKPVLQLHSIFFYLVLNLLYSILRPQIEKTRREVPGISVNTGRRKDLTTNTV